VGFAVPKRAAGRRYRTWMAAGVLLYRQEDASMYIGIGTLILIIILLILIF
jgi:hypothetical protein